MLHFSNVSIFLYEFLKFILFSQTIYKKPKLEKDYPSHRANSGPRPLLLRTGCPRHVEGHMAMVVHTGWPNLAVKLTEPAHALNATRAGSYTGRCVWGTLGSAYTGGGPGA
jgi:hypothetical protein